MKTHFFYLTLLCMVFAMLRFTIQPHSLSWEGAYQAFAHLFVGGLAGAWLATKDRSYLILVVVLTLVEVWAFVLGKISLTTSF